jgi:hypothetical protein
MGEAFNRIEADELTYNLLFCALELKDVLEGPFKWRFANTEVKMNEYFSLVPLCARRLYRVHWSTV